MPRSVAYLTVTFISLANYILMVVVPGHFQASLNPDNYFHYYIPLLGLIVPAGIWNLIEYMFFASLSPNHHFIRGRVVFALALYANLTLLVCTTLYCLFTAVDQNPDPLSESADVIASSAAAFWATIFLVTSIIATTAAYQFILQRREAASLEAT